MSLFHHVQGENYSMAKGARGNMIRVPLSKVKDNFSEFVKKAGKEEVIVTIHGRPAAVIIGFEGEDDWLEYRLLKDEKFLARISESRRQYKEGKYKTLEELS
jgi:prevent-host-death family protein